MPSMYTKAERKEFMGMYPKGCSRPSGYCDFFEWAEAQAGHGLKQKRCNRCRRYLFPQELIVHTCIPTD